MTESAAHGAIGAGWYPCGDEERVQFWDGSVWTGRWADAGIVGQIRWRPRLLGAAWLMVAACVPLLLSAALAVTAMADDREPDMSLYGSVLLAGLLATVVAPVWLLIVSASLNRFGYRGGVRMWWLLATIALTVVTGVLWWWLPAAYVWPSLLYAGIVTTDQGWRHGSRVRNWSLAAPMLALAGLPVGVLLQSGIAGSAVLLFGACLAELVASAYLIAAARAARARLTPVTTQPLQG